MPDPNHPFKTSPANIRKFLTRPYKNMGELLKALHEAAQTRPDGTFLSDKISTVAMGIAAHNIMEAFDKAYPPNATIDLVQDQCSKPYEQTSEVTKVTVVNAFIPLLSAAVKAFSDVALLVKTMDKLSKVLCDVRDQHEQDGEPYSEDFLKVAKAITKIMKPLMNKVSHPGLIDEDEKEDGDDCECPACQLRRAMKAGAEPAKKEGIGLEVAHMELTLDPTKPETWAKEIQKLAIPDEVKQMILAKVKEEHGQKDKPSKQQPPTGFDVDFRRN